MMKKISLTALLIFTLLFCLLLSGCSSDGKADNPSVDKTSDTTDNTDSDMPGASAEINIGCMKGPTAIGMIKLLSDSDKGKTQNTYHYTIAGTADELSASLLQGKMDIAAVPCNLASVLYNKTDGEILTVSINTLGVLYIVETDETIQSVADLQGKTIYSTGRGTTPEYTLRYLLTANGLNPDTDVTIEYKSEAAEVVATLAQNPEAVAMLPQPYVTAAMNNNVNLRIALNVTKEWEASAEGTVVTGVLVARRSFIEENRDAFAAFLEEYKVSTLYAKESIEETAQLLEDFDIFKAAIAKVAIPYCNVTYIAGEEMKAKATAYLQVLYDQNPASVGGSVQEGMFWLED